MSRASRRALALGVIGATAAVVLVQAVPGAQAAGGPLVKRTTSTSQLPAADCTAARQKFGSSFDCTVTEVLTTVDTTDGLYTAAQIDGSMNTGMQTGTTNFASSDSSVGTEPTTEPVAFASPPPEPSQFKHTYWRQDLCVGMFNNCSIIGAAPGWWHVHHKGNYYRTGSGGKAWVWDGEPTSTKNGGHGCTFDSSGVYTVSITRCYVYDPSDPGGAAYQYGSVRSRIEMTVCLGLNGGPVCNGGWWGRARQNPGGTVVKEKSF